MIGVMIHFFRGDLSRGRIRNLVRCVVWGNYYVSVPHVPRKTFPSLPQCFAFKGALTKPARTQGWVESGWATGGGSEAHFSQRRTPDEVCRQHCICCKQLWGGPSLPLLVVAFSAPKPTFSK